MGGTRGRFLTPAEVPHHGPTDPACRNAKYPEGKAHERLTDAGGLYLEVQPSGAKHWCWKYRFGGKEKRLSLGNDLKVTLAQARLDRDAARAVLKAGADPVQAKKDAKLADQVRLGNTFEAVARSWHENWKGAKSPRHADYVIRRLEADVFPVIGAKPVAEVTSSQLLAMAKKIEARGAVDIARRCWQTCGQVFEYALAHGMGELGDKASALVRGDCGYGNEDIIDVHEQRDPRHLLHQRRTGSVKGMVERLGWRKDWTRTSEAGQGWPPSKTSCV